MRIILKKGEGIWTLFVRPYSSDEDGGAAASAGVS